MTQLNNKIGTLAEKIWNEHVVRKSNNINKPDLIYIDFHFIHEVTSPQAFESLRLAKRSIRRPDLTIATEDHNTPTLDIHKSIKDITSRIQIETLRKNCKDFNISIYSLGNARQGIVHVIGPQLGLTQPGMTIVCGDSHTSTHGAMGSLAFGIGTSEVEHVMATQTLFLLPFKTMGININGKLKQYVTSKDIILHIISKIGTGGGQGYIFEYRGDTIKSLSIDSRMTICNMSIEAGARAGIIAPDEITFKYLKNRLYAPKKQLWSQALKYWKSLKTDDNALFDSEINVNANKLEPYVTWGTNPSQGIPISAKIPSPNNFNKKEQKISCEKALSYMSLNPGTPIKSIKVDTVFLGSCTNSRLEDLKLAANIIKGKKKHPKVKMLVVPGSAQIKYEAEVLGIDRIFKDFGAEWRFAGCSMCLGMNEDKLKKGERCASTSNRNFEGRQGPEGRTHLVSPLVAAATAIKGRISSPSDL